MTDEPMNPEIKALWLAALLSGDYAQGKNVLKTPGGQFCCLGVLCDIHAQQTGQGAWTPVSNFDDDDTDSVNYVVTPPADAQVDPLTAKAIYQSDYTLPMAVREWSGIPYAAEGTTVARLMELNDDGVPFSQIADVIQDRF